MARTLLIIATLLIVSTLAKFEYVSEISTKFELVDNIEAFRAKNPKLIVRELQKSSVEERNQARYNIHYTLGRITNGQRLVAQNSNRTSWPTAQNTRLTLTYPTSGIGSSITFVSIHVDQSSNMGTAYVTAGGIGQRAIRIVVEANQTYWFNYNATIFGI
uniref:Putative 14.5 kDa salivary protein n=1 Tax=Corethrella appendiculata TaxID=1370023 RepID=U5EKY0_9DIPT